MVVLVLAALSLAVPPEPPKPEVTVIGGLAERRVARIVEAVSPCLQDTSLDLVVGPGGAVRLAGTDPLDRAVSRCVTEAVGALKLGSTRCCGVCRVRVRP